MVFEVLTTWNLPKEKQPTQKQSDEQVCDLFLKSQNLLIKNVIDVDGLFKNYYITII